MRNGVSAQLLTVKELAKILKMSERTIWRRLSTGKLPREIRSGKLVRWNEAEIVRWIDAGCPNRLTWESKGGQR
jgi:excisionase family DNA binding protein